MIAESGHKHAGDTARVFDEMRKELRTLGSHVLGTLTFAGKDECDPLMLADILAHGTFAMEVEGDNGPTEGDSYRRPRRTGWTQLKFTGDGLATLKTKLIDGLSRGGGDGQLLFSTHLRPLGAGPNDLLKRSIDRARIFVRLNLARHVEEALVFGWVVGGYG
ncbi:hypothetical protein [Acidisphaera sp. S103]|uniref:hypothetical protein n=1 Tax=Acidisphaera sp. S103 TaxID=1747223 RepID=UPI00131B4851|nr:hypothetical protein [Acidisphaera sp. S103]